MERKHPRRWIAALIVIAVATGAALPTIGTAAEQAVRATIGTAQIKNGAVTNAKVRKGSLEYGAFKPRQVAPYTLKGIPAGGVLTGRYPAPGLATGSVKAAQIATGAVGRSEIAAGAVGSEELGAGAVRAIDLANGSVGPTKIAPNSIGKGQIAPGGVGASEIARGAVGASEMGALPGARVYSTKSSAIQSGNMQVVDFELEAYYRGGVWDRTRRDRLTAPASGVYQVTASVAFSANASGARAIWIVAASDPAVILAGERAAAVQSLGVPTNVGTSVVLYLEAGDSISLAVSQDSDRVLNVLGGDDQRTSLGLQFLSS